MRVHFVGCEGVSMRTLMRLTERMGHTVSGSDERTTGHDGKNVEGADEVVYTGAVSRDNIELATAAERGIKLTERAEYLGRLARGYGKVIAVSGCHGKTTATGMLASIFSPLDCCVHMGGTLCSGEPPIDGKRFFITEACEYRRSFLHLNPTVGVILNIELDHTDYYRDEDDVVSAFAAFASFSERCVIYGDDERTRRLAGRRSVTFGESARCDFRAVDIVQGRGGASFCVVAFGRRLIRIRLRVGGRHNVLNALAAFAAATLCGVDTATAVRGLEEFGGVCRRCETVWRQGSRAVFSDYAHHPSELKNTVAVLRESGYKKVVVVFEPHTFTRLKSLMDGFVQALSLADECILVPVYASREQPLQGVSSVALCRRLIDSGAKCTHFHAYCQAAERAVAACEGSCALAFCGAGDVDIAARLAARLLDGEQ